MTAAASPGPDDPTPDRWLPHSAPAGFDEARRRQHNRGFEARELARHADFFDRVLPQALNEEQRAAIVVDEDATLVVASAGSGKTTLLLGKIAYLVMRGLARPEEIALLAFNNSVRAEIRERLAASHPGVAVHTFHSLGLQILRESSGAAVRLSGMATDGERLRGFIGRALSALAAAEPQLLGEWLAAHFRPLRDAADFGSAREHRAWSRRNPPVTLHGERVASEPLREVADRLALAGIRSRIGARLATAPALPGYVPDLCVPDARVVIDLTWRQGRAAAGGRGEGVALRVGRELLARLACLRHGLRRVRLPAAALQYEGLLGERLAAALARFGLDLAPRALAALEGKPAYMARVEETVSLLATCLALQQTAAAAPDPPADPRDARRQQAFGAILSRVAERYRAELDARGEIDFNDMIARAVAALDRDAVAPPFRYLLVDEFQDISAGRAALVKALRRARPGMKLLAVGDVWQSIYRFAGSDVSIMTRFGQHFGITETRFLRQTFRFDRRLEAVASAFVLRNPAQIRKQVEAREPADDAPSVVLWLPREDAADDPLPDIAADLFGMPLGVRAAAPDVLILGRYRALEAQARLDWLAAHFPQARWRYSTMHRAKGATADFAVVLGVRGGGRPFPAERPEDPLLAPLLGAAEPFPHAEERRLFYVALTRARQRVYVVGDRRRPSPFFEELLATGGDIAVRGPGAAPRPPGWDNLAP